jgi:hypothetical protein
MPLMKHDVFISHSTVDKEIADQVCGYLESHGLPCWIAPRDVTPGKNYGAAILDAIDECSIFVLILSAQSNKSGQVVREVERAASSNSTIIPIRVEDVLPSRDLEFYVSSTHWLDALTRPLDKHLRDLHRAIKDWQESRRNAPAGSPPPAPATVPPAPSAQRSSLSGGLVASIILAALLLLGVGAFWLLRPTKVTPTAAATPASPAPTEAAPRKEIPPPAATPLEKSSARPIAQPTAAPTAPVPATPPPIRRRPGELLRSPAPLETTAPVSPTFSPARVRAAQPPAPSTNVESLIQEVGASSETTVSGQLRKAGFAFDGNAQSAWTPEGDGVGQSITVRFKVPVTLKDVSILAAFGNETQFRVRNRIHTMRVFLSDGTSQVLTLQDKPRVQRFEMMQPVTVTWARFQILEIFRGRKLNHTPIFEIAFNRDVVQ